MSKSNPITYIEVNACNEPGRQFFVVWFHRKNNLHNHFTNERKSPQQQARRLVRGIHCLAAIARRILEAQIEASKWA